MCELLAPVGNFECLKAAVQNGADAVYFGSSSFSARAFANNFDNNELVKAIEYAKLRGVKTHLTLNTLLKNSELKDALLLAKYAYESGIDALIVQRSRINFSITKRITRPTFTCKYSNDYSQFRRCFRITKNGISTCCIIS